MIINELERVFRIFIFSSLTCHGEETKCNVADVALPIGRQASPERNIIVVLLYCCIVSPNSCYSYLET